MSGFKIDPEATYFIDTNIWLYAFIQGQDADKNKVARTVIKDCEIVISTQIINEMCVNLIKKMAFSEIEIQNLIASLHWKYSVFELSQDILLKASQIRDIHSFSFRDSNVAACALYCDANYLISEDMQNGFLLEDRLKIVNPFTSITTIRKA